MRCKKTKMFFFLLSTLCGLFSLYWRSIKWKFNWHSKSSSTKIFSKESNRIDSGKNGKKEGSFWLKLYFFSHRKLSLDRNLFKCKFSHKFGLLVVVIKTFVLYLPPYKRHFIVASRLNTVCVFTKNSKSSNVLGKKSGKFT